VSFILETRQLCKRFGGIVATDNVDFRLAAGARHALIGPNGAGKTTFVNQLTGMVRPTSGMILFDGQDVTRWPARRRAIAGIARTFQISQLFADLTPLQSLLVAIAERERTGADWWRPVGTRSAFVAEATALLDSLDLADCVNARVGALPYGRRRLLEIALAIAARPKALLLDEPAAGIPEAEREQILDIVARLPTDVALLLIEHDMHLVFRFAKTISVLVDGAIFAEGTAAEIGRDPRVRQVYLGEEPVGDG
jgi:ABC-type branched-subunit amino acid transport system ATPase component